MTGPASIQLVGESLRLARAARAVSIIVAVLAGTTVVAVTAFSARSTEQEARLLASAAETQSRTVIVTDPGTTGAISPAMVDAICQLSSVDTALAVGPAVDVHNAFLPDDAGGVPVRTAYGSVDADRRPGCAPDRAGGLRLAPAALDELGMAGPLREVSTRAGRRSTVTDTGEFTGAFAELGTGGLRFAPPEGRPGYLTAYVVVVRPVDAGATATSLRSMFERAADGTVTVTASEGLIQLRRAIAGELTSSNRATLAGGLGVAAVLVTIVVSFATVSKRRDLGRRRALGASRRDIAQLVVVSTVLQAGAGCAVATIAIAVIWRSGVVTTFGSQASILMILSAALGAVVPAAIAATRDPIRVLRTP